MIHSELVSRVGLMASHVVAAVSLVGTLGCADREHRDAASIDSPGPMLIGQVDTIVPQSVLWEATRLDTTLRVRGFSPVPVPLRTRNPFPDVPAVAYRVDGAEIDAYFFGDPDAAARGLPQVDAAADTTANAFTSNNMVVVVRAERAGLRERIRRVLTDPKVEGPFSR